VKSANYFFKLVIIPFTFAKVLAVNVRISNFEFKFQISNCQTVKNSSGPMDL
jgi:hypothetical protein